MDQLKHSWTLFSDLGNTSPFNYPSGTSYNVNPTRARFSSGNEKTIITSVYSRIATDAASMDIKHVRLDKDGRYSEDMVSGLNNCLTVEANIDQASKAFLRDIIISMMDEGVVAVVPVETLRNPNLTDSYDITSMRTGRIIEWFPSHVKVKLYDERIGEYQDVTVNKKYTAIVENPFYSIMNEPNSTMQRLIRKLSLMDIIDEESSSGKLDLIVQLPYAIKNQMKQEQADMRRKAIEEQLQGSRYGIAYIDSTEHVTQLNRSLDNNMLKQVEYLTNLLYAQLGLTQTIMDGSADEKTMNNYYTRTVEPIVGAIVEEFHRKFLTKTARTQGQAIVYYRDPFKLTPVNEVADMADKFTRNEILSSNEFRQIIGRKPSKDPSADELRNKNISQSKEEIEADLLKKQGNNKIQNEKDNVKEEDK